MKKETIIEMLQAKGFTASEWQTPGDSEMLLLTKSYEKVDEVVWHGKVRTTVKVEVLVNITSGICFASFFNGGRASLEDANLRHHRKAHL